MSLFSMSKLLQGRHNIHVHCTRGNADNLVTTLSYTLQLTQWVLYCDAVPYLAGLGQVSLAID